MKKIMLSLFLLLLASCLYAADFDAYNYWVTPGTRRTIAWDPVAGADKYEVSIRRMESGRTLYQGFVNTPQITVKFNSTGHNVVYIRAFINGIAGEWQNTLDPLVSTVNSKNKAWVILVPTS